MPTKPKVEETAGELKEKKQPHELGILRRLTLATLGAAAIAKEEIEDLLDHLVERGEVVEKDSKKFINEVADKRKRKTAKIEDEISKNLEGVLNRMNFSSKSDIDAVNQKIGDLSKKIDDLKKP